MRCDVRDHNSDHRPSYLSYSALQRLRCLKIYPREILLIDF